MNFKSPHFTFDGISSKDFQLRICRVGKSDSTGIFGVERSIEEEVGNGLIPVFKKVKYNSVSIPLTLIKTDGDNPLPFTEDDKFEIVKWLFQDEYKPFTSEDKKDVVYYAIFTKGSNYENALKHGYINLTMRLNAPFGYSNLLTSPTSVVGETVIELFNRSNVGEFIYPDIELKTNQEITDIEIENLSTGDIMTFTDLPVESHVYCYNEDLKQFLMKNNPSYNVRKHYKGNWLKLAYGRNLIRVKSKNCQIKLIAQSKIALT